MGTVQRTPLALALQAKYQTFGSGVSLEVVGTRVHRDSLA